MEETARFRFDSFTFFVGFGLGSFIGVALALLAIALVSRSDASDTQQPSEAAIVIPTFPPTPAGATATPDLRPRTKAAQDVYVGPGTAFAVVGILAREEAVEVVGRSADSNWVAIRFPPGSPGRGWLPVGQLEGVTNLEALAVALPTPLPRNVAPPSLPSFPGTQNNVSPVGPVVRSAQPEDESPPGTQAAPVPRGPANLVMNRVMMLPDGRVRVVVGNIGPGDLLEQQVNVTVRDLGSRSELLISPTRGLAVGETITLTTSYFFIQNVTTVHAIADPSGNINDADRSNNSLTVTLTPPPTPTPTPAGRTRDEDN
jgi:hypothetical protein